MPYSETDHAQVSEERRRFSRRMSKTRRSSGEFSLVGKCDESLESFALDLPLLAG